MLGIFFRILNKLFKYKLYRIQKITWWQLLCEALTRQNLVIKFVQIGANDGVQFDSLYFTVTSGGWGGIVVEPLKDLFDRLAANYQDYSSVTPVNVALHPTKDEENIYRVGRSYLSSYPAWAAGIASMDKSHLLKHNIKEEHINCETVQCKSFMSLLIDYNCLNADVLQIDTEGFDAEVIRMIDFSRFRPIMIKFEWMNLSSREQCGVKEILQNQGYTFRVEPDGADAVAWIAGKISP